MHRYLFKDWVYSCYLTAAYCFYIQQWLYVSQYTRVSIMAPLTFCLQTDQVKKKRQCFIWVMLGIDCIAYTLFFFNLLLSLGTDWIGVWYVDLIWSIMSIVLTVALCMSLRRIRNYTKTLANAGYLSNKGLILAHQSSFVAASVITLIAFSLNTYERHLSKEI